MATVTVTNVHPGKVPMWIEDIGILDHQRQPYTGKFQEGYFDWNTPKVLQLDTLVIKSLATGQLAKMVAKGWMTAV